MSSLGPVSLQATSDGWKKFSDLVCNKLTDGVEGFLKKFLGADLFIVTGPAGVGKSSFIKSVTGEDVYIGSTLESGTKQTALVPVIIGNKRCLFLDMPGFNTRDFDDEDIFFRLMAAMSVVQPYVQFRGVIYVDSMNETRVTPSAVKILTWLSLFCGQQYMPNVLIVTTYWDKLGEDGIKDKLSLIEKWKNEELLQGLCKHGVGFYHHGLVKEKGEYKTLHIERKAEERRSLARNVIMTRFAKSTDLRLQIYIEIAKGATVDETSAGRWLLHGHAADNSQDHGKEHTDDSSRRASSENEQKSQNEEDASANADTGPSSDSSRSDTYFAYWKDLKYEHVKPWINLLFKAAKVYMSSSREEITFEDDEWPDFNEDDDWPNLFQDDWSSSEHVFDPKPRSRSGWCPIM